MNIKIVYFCYLIPNKWESIILEQLESLYSITNLYEQSQIYLSVIDDTELQSELEKLRKIIESKYNKIKIVNICLNNLYEYPGIKTVYELSTNNDNEYILYFHSKGMTSNQHKIRQILFKHTIENYEIILEEMEKNKEIDVSAVIPSVHGFGYYNFFWARSSYINKYCSKPECTEKYMKHRRFTWEMWIGNHYTNKNYIKTYSPIFKYNQVYGDRETVFFMDLLIDDKKEIINSLSDSNEFNNILKIYSKNMNEIANNLLTDKNTAHSYFDVYEELFNPIRCTANNILEVGIYHGGSIQLWRDYFINAKIFAVDVCNLDFIKEEKIKNDHNITLFTNTNGYDDNFINENFYNKNIKFDVILDDGPHTLQSNIDFIIKYLPLLSENGIMIIEDIQDFNWTETLKEYVPPNFKKYIKVYDLREIRNRYDNTLFVINKNII
jgi:hypothetical protein